MRLILCLCCLLAATPAVAQIGPDPSFHLPVTDRAPNAPNPRHHIVTAVPAPATGLFHDCLSQANIDPAAAQTTANLWASKARGADLAEAKLCLGTAYAAQESWDEAITAFLAGREAVPAADLAMRARLGEMAGDAALAGDAPDRALAALTAAAADAAGGDAQLAGDIAIDRARALVALNRADEASTALSEARRAAPDDATAWLLSATLSRRQHRLNEAQNQIETAVRLAPADPAVALEAGIIAVLAGNDAAARKDWQSVIAAAPDSDAARQARADMDQLSPAATH